ncbi:tetratricopeptide repeat protein [Chromatium okenii]|jgi:TPR repeat protein|uniref:Sel1 repeat family protein n=1 Tax=Chromatium okenii TaxID=61644 RepID=A0A2S7XS36_9GAMM|nr:tetratricopeptide repeat protein [Chromatium okenii]MBV5311101.1 sel1 repeat family protein [Chromatium okenii]PQJ96564.1 hypothetical protein CXB77_07015 [Chromatium okenii]
MPSISLNTATALTGLSKRTLWRHIHRGSLAVISEQGEETQVSLTDVLPLACVPLTAAEHALVLAADGGDPLAQTDLALLFFDAERPTEAVSWLIRAANQRYPDAMCYLGRCYLSGCGIARDNDNGALWLSHAAIKGHPLAQALTQWLQTQDALADEYAVRAAFDRIESAVLLQALYDTATT